MDYVNFNKFSNYPIVCLRKPDLPDNGASVSTPTFCSKQYKKSASCKAFYQSLIDQTDGFYNCPNGFSCYKTRIQAVPIAITAFIPFPRTKHKNEQHLAKLYPLNKIESSLILDSIKSLNIAARYFTDLEDNIIRQYSMALHEIRKLNRNIKQTSDRLLRSSPSGDIRFPDKIKYIYKSSEMMSTQFDIIEILANESLAQLPLKTESEIYRLVDKCAIIYQTDDNRIKISCQQNYSPHVLVCDKTIAIIPTSLLENAVKFSCDGSEISVKISRHSDQCLLEISNTSNNGIILDQSIFEKGKRLDTKKEGSGNGLYVAQLVAKQHKTKIEITSKPIRDSLVSNHFRIYFREIQN